MGFKLLLVLAISLSCAQCSPSPTGVPFEEQFILKVGESRSVDNGRVEVGLTKVVEDSRCPLNAICVWEGDAAVLIWVKQIYGEQSSYVLHTYPGFERELTYGEYRIRLVQVSPYPEEGQKIPEDEYEITLDVGFR